MRLREGVAVGRTMPAEMGEIYNALQREIKAQITKVDNRTGAGEEVHTKNAVDVKAVVNTADFDLKVIDRLRFNRHTINPACKHGFSPADARTV